VPAGVDVEARHRQETFRAVNERIRELAESFEAAPADEAEFICECAVLGCAELIRVPLGLYREVSAAPGRYLLRAGHETAGHRVAERPAADVVVVEWPR
jgi:hypothetical protein